MCSTFRSVHNGCQNQPGGARAPRPEVVHREGGLRSVPHLKVERAVDTVLLRAEDTRQMLRHGERLVAGGGDEVNMY
jgi:hypothetical protein